VKPQISVKYIVPSKVFVVLRSDLEHIAKQSRIEYGVRVTIPSYNTMSTKEPISLRVLADGVEAPKLVGKIKGEIEKLLAGTVVTHDGAPLWHPFFVTPTSLSYLVWLSGANNIYVHRDLRKSQLVLYGGATSNRKVAQHALVLKVSGLSEERQTIVSTRPNS